MDLVFFTADLLSFYDFFVDFFFIEIFKKVFIEDSFFYSSPLVVFSMAFLLDLLWGDPNYAFHPTRLMGKVIQSMESYFFLRRWNGYLAGIFLVLFLSLIFVGLYYFVLYGLSRIHFTLPLIWNIYIAWSGLALRDLVFHAKKVRIALKDMEIDRDSTEEKRVTEETEEKEEQKLLEARLWTSFLVARDTKGMSVRTCRRASIESLSENFVDGVLTPMFYLFFSQAILGGVVLLLWFKLVSTLDSMIGHKNARYHRFGFFSARLDDLLNYIPSRFAWLLLSFLALFWGAGMKTFLFTWKNAKLFPSPNSGWAEASFATALGIRLVGPIYKEGKLVSSQWIGLKSDPKGGRDRDLKQAIFLVYILSFFSFLLFGIFLYFLNR